VKRGRLLIRKETTVYVLREIKGIIEGEERRIGGDI